MRIREHLEQEVADKQAVLEVEWEWPWEELEQLDKLEVIGQLDKLELLGQGSLVLVAEHKLEVVEPLEQREQFEAVQNRLAVVVEDNRRAWAVVEQEERSQRERPAVDE